MSTITVRDARSRPRTAIFGTRVAEAMTPPPPTVYDDATCIDAVSRMRETGASAVVVIDDRTRPVGIVTEQDIVRRAAFAVAPDAPLVELMTQPVETLPADEFLYHAIGRMLKLQLRHLPVIDAAGELAGMLHLNGSLAAAAGRTLDHIRRLTHENDLQGMRSVKIAQAALAAELLEEDHPAHEVQALLTHVNNDLYGRILRRRLAQLDAMGHGAPPVDFCLLVMGSGGRGENFLAPDQDHGLILDNYPDTDHDRIDVWFRNLADGLIEELAAVGFPQDAGYVMCINPLWRKTLSQWRTQMQLWAHRNTAMTVRLADIFFDFTPVHGRVDLGHALRDTVRTVGLTTPALLQNMLHEHEDQGVALGVFNRFITLGRDSEHRGHLNLKHTGTLPLVAALRLLALKHGIVATGTRERLHQLTDAGAIDAAERDALLASSAYLSDCILRHQIRQIQHGETPDYYLDPATLDHHQTSRIKRALRVIRRLRDRVRTEITGQVF